MYTRRDETGPVCATNPPVPFVDTGQVGGGLGFKVVVRSGLCSCHCCVVGFGTDQAAPVSANDAVTTRFERTGLLMTWADPGSSGCYW